MIEGRYYGLAAAYTVVSVSAGLLAVYAATVVVRKVGLR